MYGLQDTFEFSLYNSHLSRPTKSSLQFKVLTLLGTAPLLRSFRHLRSGERRQSARKQVICNNHPSDSTAHRQDPPHKDQRHLRHLRHHQTLESTRADVRSGRMTTTSVVAWTLPPSSTTSPPPHTHPEIHLTGPLYAALDLRHSGRSVSYFPFNLSLSLTWASEIITISAISVTPPETWPTSSSVFGRIQCANAVAESLDCFVWTHSIILLRGCGRVCVSVCVCARVRVGVLLVLVRASVRLCGTSGQACGGNLGH